MGRKRYLLIATIFTFLVVAVMGTQFTAFAWTATLVKDDPLVRMPGTQSQFDMEGNLITPLIDSSQCGSYHQPRTTLYL